MCIYMYLYKYQGMLITRNMNIGKPAELSNARWYKIKTTNNQLSAIYQVTVYIYIYIYPIWHQD